MGLTTFFVWYGS